MKKNNYFILTAISIVLMASFLGCQKEVAVTNVTLDKKSLALLVGESETLLATVLPKTATNKEIMWSSADPDIASINADGTISAKAVGTTTITATAIDGGLSASCRVIVVLTTEFRIWGLGENLTDAQSNNVSYEWYIDQGNTGVHSYVNCGPASVTMAIKWSNQNFTKTTEDARKTRLPNGGWWYTDDIINYLNSNQTSHFTAALTNTGQIVSQLNSGNIAILCLDAYYIRYSQTYPEWRTDKFYVTENPEWGHFIVVKGYKIVDDIIWFEVYDPWSLNVKYLDGSFKGRDRYYRGEDIIRATNVWWKYMIVINSTVTRAKAIDVIEIDPSTIVHQWGR